MAKHIAEQSDALSIFWLKKHGYLNKDYSLNSGSITWSYGWSENKNSIGFSVIRQNWGTPQETAQIELRYTQTSRWTEEKNDMNYRIELTTTPCNYGGVRYWFICPLYKNGQYCGKRVGVIYSAGKYFGCRTCANIAYSAQMQGGRFRVGSFTVSDIERFKTGIKRYYYNGKPTRKHRRLMKMDAKLGRSFMLMAANLGHPF